MINESISELGGQDVVGEDLSSSVVTICERLHTLEEECETLNGTRDALNNSIVQTKKDLKDALLQNEELQVSLKEKTQQVDVLNRKQKELQGIVANIRGRTKDLEDEKLRQVSYLEKENLHVLEENKELKKAVRDMKTRSKAKSLEIHDDPTEELTSILPTSSSLDKENIVNGSTNTKGVDRSVQKIQKRRVGLSAGLGAAGVGEGNDENTQECTQS